MVILCLSPYNFPSLRGVQASAIPLPHVGSAASEFVLTINTTHPPPPPSGRRVRKCFVHNNQLFFLLMLNIFEMSRTIFFL